MAASKNLSPEQRALRARAAAHSMHAKHDPKETTAAGTAAFLKRFLDEVDPDRVLPPEERERRAEHARKAYMTRIAFQQSKAASRDEAAS